jgi:AraC family transcriptional regulator, regulatory protein of adaptative response / DNA-3-methyladenine glycosylase II
VTLDPDTCYRALRARDERFDGLFFVAVETTGIYCRPICPARTPAQARCAFFVRAAEAERAGFRACFRCRPELAPGSAPVDSVPRLVQSAVARIDAGCLNEGGVDELAAALGVTSRHLRRAMESELGLSPVDLAQTRRLALAKQLLQDTALPLTEVAFAAGFSSVRRFNALFQARFGRPPSALRRENGAGSARDCIALRLDHRSPLAWDTLLGFLAARAVPGVEAVEGGEYRRTARLGDQVGWLAVRRDERRTALRARVSLSLASKLMTVVARLRALFDLDAQPDVVAQHLRREPLLAPLVDGTPGLRVPGAFDAFETAVRAVLGQQVSVRGATTLSGRLVQRFGVRVAAPADAAGLEWLFPTPSALAGSSVEAVAAIGLPAMRARTILELARAFAEGRVELSSGAAPESVVESLVALPGIGPWTAHYIAMRALRWSDAFPAADLGVRKALGVESAKAAEERALAWRPWRAYGVMHLWNALSQGG